MSNIKSDYLTDYSFLEKINNEKIQDLFIKMTILDWHEKPIQDIQGRVTGGNLNLNGNSPIRRTCNLSMVVKEKVNNFNDINYLFSLNKKCKVEIGFLNNTNQYLNDSIIWMPLGVYVIFSPSITKSLDNVNISVQLKDKMCLLNGEMGGTFPASVVLHEKEILGEDGEYQIVNPTIYEIIMETVNHFGGEDLNHIIINDIPKKIKKVMKWVGNKPLYISSKMNGESIQYEYSFNSSENSEKYTAGRDIGYVYSDFVFPGELIANGGQPITAILDTIKNTLGNYEYFYDVYGNFIFQEIKNYLNTNKPSSDLNKLQSNNYSIDVTQDKNMYYFNNNNLISSFSNAPNYNLIKNDFIVWGERKDSQGKKIPIRYHLAIDKKPTEYNTYLIYFYENRDKIKQAKQVLEMESRPLKGEENIVYCFTEEDKERFYRWDSKSKSFIEEIGKYKTIKTTDWRSELYMQGVVSENLGLFSNDYYVELVNEWPKLYDIEKGEFINKSFSDLDYFLDFIDESSEVGDLSISHIGKRSKVITDTSVNCIFEPEIPNLILLKAGEENDEMREECLRNGQDFIQLDPSIFNNITQGGNFNSAFYLVQQLLNESVQYNNSISIQSLPIYYLEPNTRINVQDVETNIFGDYLIQSISMPLTINGTMSITAVKIINKI